MNFTNGVVQMNIYLEFGLRFFIHTLMTRIGRPHWKNTSSRWKKVLKEYILPCRICLAWMILLMLILCKYIHLRNLIIIVTKNKKLSIFFLRLIWNA